MSTQREFEFTFAHFDALRKQAHNYSGINFTDDKLEMFYARLAKRLRKLGITSFSEYVKRVKQDQAEFSEFVNAVTTNITAFEREPHHFAHLKEQMKTFKKSTVNIWSAGCSTGQEPYTILVNILPFCRQKRIEVKVLASDLDTDVLSKAQAGIYKVKDVEMYGQAVKKQFFRKGIGPKEGFCMVKPVLSECIEFRQLNLFYPWKLDRKFDFIFCRNVLIYFEQKKKLEIIDRFASNLVPNGILFLGHSELIPRDDPRWKNIGTNMYQLTGAG
ncbi:protein-glutamate O-methyltransferase CheR [Alteromonas sediminis]|uniref:Chemotaxis protein methyltransferase n=1 Tax=Alteromonas sediminis TaxID=2259342 RepID=A0A3N5ZDR7_9ALTE|nr:protein-glutamate O-methyltransferase CheR [Alteromonas sediminis]RPJ68338.1 protein-glutamate O-methyltransferase CheR [Alteromonas sediminis]